MDTLEKLAQDAMRTVESGFYNVSDIATHLTRSDLGLARADHKSLVGEIKQKNAANKNAVICEVKFASPSAGQISKKQDQVSKIAKEMEVGGAAGLSVLTEPRNFNGSLENLVSARENTSIPILMKDIIVSTEQIIAAATAGASAVLLIEEIYSSGHSMDNLSLNDAIKLAGENGLEVIVETHSRGGLDSIAGCGCDIIGINNRDLSTFKTSIETTLALLKDFTWERKGVNLHPEDERTFPLIMSESGFEYPEDILSLRKALRANGSLMPDAFLIGTSIMRSDNIVSKVKGFVEASH